MPRVFDVPRADKPHDLSNPACWCGAVGIRDAAGMVIVCHRDNIGIALKLHPVLIAQPTPEIDGGMTDGEST